MELENLKQNEHINKLVSPIFQKEIENSSKGNNKNHMLVGSGQNPEKTHDLFYLWNPHNFRRYYIFKHDNFTPKKRANLRRLKTNVGLYTQGDTIIFLPFNNDYIYKNQNYGSEHHYFNFFGCTIKVRKSTIEVICTELKDKWFKIHAYSTKDIDIRIDQIVKEIEDHCKKALVQFINIHGGRSDFHIIKRHSENKIKNDGFIEKIPINMIIHDTVMKKVYKENSVEIYGEASVKNHFKNTTLSYVAPDIANEMGKITSALGSVSSSMESMANIQGIFVNETKGIILGLQEQIKSHLALIQEYRKEAIEYRKPFFIRWFNYLVRR